MKIKKFNENKEHGWKSTTDKDKVIESFNELTGKIESLEIEIANARDDYGDLQGKYRTMADQLRTLIRNWDENYM